MPDHSHTYHSTIVRKTDGYIIWFKKKTSQLTLDMIFNNNKVTHNFCKTINLVAKHKTRNEKKPGRYKSRPFVGDWEKPDSFYSSCFSDPIIIINYWNSVLLLLFTHELIYILMCNLAEEWSNWGNDPYAIVQLIYLLSGIN